MGTSITSTWDERSRKLDTFMPASAFPIMPQSLSSGKHLSLLSPGEPIENETPPLAADLLVRPKYTRRQIIGKISEVFYVVMNGRFAYVVMKHLSPPPLTGCVTPFILRKRHSFPGVRNQNSQVPVDSTAHIVAHVSGSQPLPGSVPR